MNRDEPCTDIVQDEQTWTMYRRVCTMYIQGWTVMKSICTLYVHVYAMLIHVLTSYPNRFSWPTQRCRTEGYPSVFSRKGGRGRGQSLSRRWWFFLCKARRSWSRKSCLIRQVKRPSGILKRNIAFCTRYAKLCCGETRITRHVKHQRLVNVYVHVYTLYIICTYKWWNVYGLYMHVCIVYIQVCSDFQPWYVFCSMPILKTSKLWPTL